VPEELKRERRWILWKYSKPVRGKRTKPPCCGFKTNEKSTWLSFEDAVERAESDSRVAGIGIVLGDGLVGFDADECLDGNRMPTNDFARDVLSLNTYTEVSPSGTGVKAILRGTIRENHNLRAKDGLPKREVYDGRQSCARFFTITGERYGSATEIRADIQEQVDRVYDKHFRPYEKPPKVQRGAQTSPPQEDYNDTAVGLSDDTILDLLREAKNRKKFERLFLGVWDDYDSQSEADAALVAMFRFYSRDVPQIDRLFRQSGLHRPKWGERRGAMTYGETTIRNILAKGGRRYGFDRPRNPRMQVLPAWYSKALKGCGALGTRLAYGVFPWYADDEGFCGRLTGAQLAREAGVKPKSIWKALPRLEQAGIICIAASDGKVHEYRLALGDAPFVTRFEPKPIVLKSNKARSTK
jgi:primase-polymerase (primpol)-like protein